MTSAEARIRSLARWRLGLVVAAVAIPIALAWVFERQARRLDALAEHGEVVVARVTATSRDITYYAYRVDGVEHTWNVHRREAPYPAGAELKATYLPEEPSFSRPIEDRTLAAREAARNRSFTWKVVLGAALVLTVLVFLVDRDLRRLRRGEPAVPPTPAQYRRRAAIALASLLPFVAAIAAFHVHDAVERGQSLAPIVLAVLLVVAILGGTTVFVVRGGPSEARQRAAKLARWVAPIAIAVACLRLLALALDG